jgi:uncharacterized Zn finger protein
MAARSRLGAHISTSGLKLLAGGTYYERGLDYFEAGAVVLISGGKHAIAARVQGSEVSPYAVRFWLEERKLRWGCTCPLGVDGEFCKHLVAAGLAWLSGMATKGDPAIPEVLEPIRDFLDVTEQRVLTRLILERAMWDEDLLNELILVMRALRGQERDQPRERPAALPSTRALDQRQRRRPKN